MQGGAVSGLCVASGPKSSFLAADSPSAQLLAKAQSGKSGAGVLVPHARWGHSFQKPPDLCLLWKRVATVATDDPACRVLAPLLLCTAVTERRKHGTTPRNYSLPVFTLHHHTRPIDSAVCAMDRRTFEGPMDWEYQSQPPVDHSSPFAKFSQKAANCESSSPTLCTREVSALPPPVRQPAAALRNLRRAHHGRVACLEAPLTEPLSPQQHSTRRQNSDQQTRTPSPLPMLRRARPSSPRANRGLPTPHSSTPSCRASRPRQHSATPPSPPPRSV